MIILVFSSNSCERNRFEFPYVPINLNISLSALDAEIGPGDHKFMYENEGVNGLLIFRNYDNEYFVYDRTCTYEPDFSCKVVSDTIILHVTCPCCNSQYFLDPADEFGEAYVTRGPSKYNLVRYDCFINGGFLTVRN